MDSAIAEKENALPIIKATAAKIEELRPNVLAQTDTASGTPPPPLATTVLKSLLASQVVAKRAETQSATVKKELETLEAVANQLNALNDPIGIDAIDAKVLRDADDAPTVIDQMIALLRQKHIQSVAEAGGTVRA